MPSEKDIIRGLVFEPKLPHANHWNETGAINVPPNCKNCVSPESDAQLPGTRPKPGQNTSLSNLPAELSSCLGLVFVDIRCQLANLSGPPFFPVVVLVPLLGCTLKSASKSLFLGGNHCTLENLPL